jgi:hypothetical protein
MRHERPLGSRVRCVIITQVRCCVITYDGGGHAPQPQRPWPLAKGNGVILVWESLTSMCLLMRLPCLHVGAPSASSLPPQRGHVSCMPIRGIAPALPPPAGRVSARPPPTGVSALSIALTLPSFPSQIRRVTSSARGGAGLAWRGPTSL